MNTVANLIEMMDIECGDFRNLFLGYITSSKSGLHVCNANAWIQSNNSLELLVIPPWSLNKQMDLGRKMKSIIHPRGWVRAWRDLLVVIFWILCVAVANGVTD